MEPSSGRQHRAPERPQHPAAPAPTKTTAFQLQVLQQVNLPFHICCCSPKWIRLNPIQVGSTGAETHPSSNRPTDDLTMLSITIITSLGSTPCFHSFKINLWLAHPWSVAARWLFWTRLALERWSTGVLPALNAHKTNYAWKGITFLMAHKELHHTSKAVQRLSLGRWRIYERQTQTLLN